MTFKRSKNLAHLEASVVVAIKQEALRRQNAGEDVIDLSVGEPDFDTPRIPSEAGIKAIQQGKTHYPPNAGILELRAAAARHLSLLSGGRPINADHILVSNGARQSIFNALFTLKCLIWVGIIFKMVKFPVDGSMLTKYIKDKSSRKDSFPLIPS